MVDCECVPCVLITIMVLTGIKKKLFKKKISYKMETWKGWIILYSINSLGTIRNWYEEE